MFPNRKGNKYLGQIKGKCCMRGFFFPSKNTSKRTFYDDIYQKSMIRELKSFIFSDAIVPPYKMGKLITHADVLPYYHFTTNRLCNIYTVKVCNIILWICIHT